MVFRFLNFFVYYFIFTAVIFLYVLIPRIAEINITKYPDLFKYHISTFYDLNFILGSFTTFQLSSLLISFLIPFVFDLIKVKESSKLKFQLHRKYKDDSIYEDDIEPEFYGNLHLINGDEIHMLNNLSGFYTYFFEYEENWRGIEVRVEDSQKGVIVIMFIVKRNWSNWFRRILLGKYKLKSYKYVLEERFRNNSESFVKFMMEQYAIEVDDI
jgi:hypothetical protein